MYRVFLFLKILLSGLSIAFSQDTTEIDINQEWSRTEVKEKSFSDGTVKAKTEFRTKLLSNDLKVIVAVDKYQRITDEKSWSEFEWMWQVNCRDLKAKDLSKSAWTVVATRNTNDFTHILPIGGGGKTFCPIGFEIRLNKKGRDFLVVIDQRETKEQVIGVFVIEENGYLNVDPSAEELKWWNSMGKSSD